MMTSSSATSNGHIPSLEGNLNELLVKITSASALEKSEQFDEAIALYQDIATADPEGSYGAVARKALEKLVQPEATLNGDISPASSVIKESPISSVQQPDGISTASVQDTAKPETLLAKITSASALEKAGQTQEAIALYTQVLTADPDGTYGAIARKALETLLANDAQSATSTKGQTVLSTEPRKNETLPLHKQLLHQFYDLPIQRKQFLGLLASETVSVVGLVGVGALLIISNGHAKLREQAQAELEVAKINYNVKINQMGFGFAGNAENPAVIESAEKGKPDPKVTTLLANELWRRKIEIAALVDVNGNMVASGNINRPGTKFDPQGVVTEALKTGEQVKASQWISYDDLAQESPRVAELRAKELGLDPALKPDFLIRYTATPVRQGNGLKAGALVSGDIVKTPIVANTTETFKGGYSAAYLVNPEDGSLSLAASHIRTQDKTELNLPSDNSAILEQAVDRPGDVLTGATKVGDRTYTVAVQALTNLKGEPIAVLMRGTPRDSLNALIRNSLLLQLLVTAIALTADAGIARLLTHAIARPIEKLKEVTQAFSSGDRSVRATVEAKDEVGDLAGTFNTMIDSIAASEQELETQYRTQEQEANRQREAKEQLQQGVIQLLLDIEGASKGDLTASARVTEGAVGSIADAFNATLRSLRQLVSQVSSVTYQVGDRANACANTVDQLSTTSLTQAEEVQRTLGTVAEMNTSIQMVAQSAAQSAAIARQVLTEAQAGDALMDETVASIDKIQVTVSSTAKKIKHLAESSQEISQIVGIISGISEKTNLLAFNASIEASRAGEHGQGFRVVADEVRRLADRVTEATKDIQGLVSAIQQETATVLETMETSTAEVLTGTQLVNRTKQTLRSLAEISQQIDQNLQEISSNTAAQTQASAQVNQVMASVAAIAQNTSAEAESMATTLKSLVGDVETLQGSMSKFRFQA